MNNVICLQAYRLLTGQILQPVRVVNRQAATIIRLEQFRNRR